VSQANVELVRRVLVLTHARCFDDAFALLHPNVEWVVAREHPNSRVVVGHDALAAYQREWEQMLGDLRFEIDRFLDVDDRVVGIGTVRGTGAGSGADVGVPLAMVYTLRDGLITRAEEYLDPAEALQAAGLEA
jgi:ketosteroid isomerase-like protein